MENRRNYYRILQVQPDAPEEIIKASYRTLMQKLKMHPDLGGDHWNASLLNEAYQVLMNPQARLDYDKNLLLDLNRRSEPPKTSVSMEKSRVARQQYPCLFCKTLNWALPEPQITICWECSSPLTKDLENRKRSSKRNMERMNSRVPVTFFTHWPHSGLHGVVTNMSPLGFCLESQQEIARNTVVKVDSDFFHALCRVTRCLATSNVHFPFELGLDTLSIVFESRPGKLLSITV